MKKPLKFKPDLSIYSDKEIDKLMAEAERSAREMSRRQLEAQYAIAIGNWNYCINERNALLKKLQQPLERVTVILPGGSRAKKR